MSAMNDNVLFLDDRKSSPASQPAAQWQCANQLALFFQYLDEQRYDDLIALFTDEGRWHRQGRLLVGGYAMLDALQARPSTTFTRHVLGAPCVTPGHGDRVTVQAAVTVYAAAWDEQHTLPLVTGGPSQLLNTTATMVPTRRGYEIAELVNTPIFRFVPQAQAAGF